MNEKSLLHNGQAEKEDSSKVFCTYCPGFCCYRLPGSILFVTAEDINRIARHFHISDGEVRKKYLEGKNTFKVKEDGSCIFLMDGRLAQRCAIHGASPRQCKDFPYGEPCPYLLQEELLRVIYPKIEKSLKISTHDKKCSDHM